VLTAELDAQQIAQQPARSKVEGNVTAKDPKTGEGRKKRSGPRRRP